MSILGKKEITLITLGFAFKNQTNKNNKPKENKNKMKNNIEINEIQNEKQRKPMKAKDYF